MHEGMQSQSAKATHLVSYILYASNSSLDNHQPLQHQKQICMQSDEGQPHAGRPTNRAMQRRPGLLQQANEDSCSQDVLGSSHPETLKPRRLETHTWHAKRMQMSNRQVLMADAIVLAVHVVKLLPLAQPF